MNSQVEEAGFAEEGVTIGRIMSFSDAIFAVAITLLILNINIPLIPKDQVTRDLGPAVRQLLPHFWSFTLSFVVIGVYWMSHHAVFRFIKRSDRTFLWCNLIFMMSIVVMPFSTNLLGAYGSNRLAVMFYAGNLTATGTLIALLWWYATRRHRLVDKELEPALRNHVLLASLLPAAIFFISIFVALASPALAKYVWLAIIPVDFLFHGHFRLSRHKAA